MKRYILSAILALALVVGAALILSLTAHAQSPAFTIEPTILSTGTGGTISAYVNSGVTVTFLPTTTVRMVGYGLLTTQVINPQALQAVVPPGLSAGTYTLVALSTSRGDYELGSIRLVAPPAPTATPKPDEGPPPGQPLLTIRNYRIDPPQVKPGQEFTVWVQIYNNGSRAGENTLVIFPGGTFLPVGESGHNFWQVPINATFEATQKMRVPTSVGNGVFPLEVAISANDWSGAHFDFPQNVQVEVIGAASGSAPTGQPEVLVEDLVTDPALIAPGIPFSLTLRLANRGSRTATNLQVRADAAAAIPAEGGGIAVVEVLKIDDVVTVTLPLILKPVKEGGRLGLSVNMSYSDYSGGTHSSEQVLGIDVDTSLANRPQLLISGYHTTPDQISPGDSFTMTLEVVNVGGGAAQRLTLALGGENGEELGAFAPIGGSNVSFVPVVDRGESSRVELRLMVASSAETKAHSLPVLLAYDTAGGTRTEDTQRVSVLVRRRPAFKVSFYRPVEGSAMAGQPFELPIEMVNSSAYRFTVSELSVAGEGLEFMGTTSTYVGPLDPNASWTLDSAAMQMEPGTAQIVVSVAYLDDLNQTQIYSESLPVEVMENPFIDGGEGLGPENGEGMPEEPLSFGGQVLRFLKALFGLGS